MWLMWDSYLWSCCRTNCARCHSWFKYSLLKENETKIGLWLGHVLHELDRNKEQILPEQMLCWQEVLSPELRVVYLLCEGRCIRPQGASTEISTFIYCHPSSVSAMQCCCSHYNNCCRPTCLPSDLFQSLAPVDFHSTHTVVGTEVFSVITQEVTAGLVRPLGFKVRFTDLILSCQPFTAIKKTNKKQANNNNKNPHPKPLPIWFSFLYPNSESGGYGKRNQQGNPQWSENFIICSAIPTQSGVFPYWFVICCFSKLSKPLARLN